MKTRSDIGYVIAIIMIGIVAVMSTASVVAIALFSASDNTFLIGIIFGAAAPTIAGLLSLAKSIQNGNDLDETKGKVNKLAIDVDGRLTQLLEAKTEAAHSAGIITGTQDERDRATLIALPPA